MSILGSIAKVGTKYAQKLFNYGIRAVKASPKLVFGTNSDTVGQAMRTAYKEGTGSIFTKTKSAIKAGGKVLETGATGKAFWKAVGRDIAGLPRAIARSSKAGYLIAKNAGKSGIWGGVKGFFGGIAKKMPLIGTLITIGYELWNNIIPATKDRGAGEAVKETGKAAARIVGGATGAAIGSAILPGIGSLIGWVAGEWLAGKVVGKSYSDRKTEAEEILINAGLSKEEVEAIKAQGGDIIEAAEKIKAAAEKGEAAETSQATSSKKASETSSGTTVKQNLDPYGFKETLNILNSNYLARAYAMSNPAAISGSNPFTMMQYPQFNYSA